MGFRLSRSYINITMKTYQFLLSWSQPLWEVWMLICVLNFAPTYRSSSFMQILSVCHNSVYLNNYTLKTYNRKYVKQTHYSNTNIRRNSPYQKLIWNLFFQKNKRVKKVAFVEGRCSHTKRELIISSMIVICNTELLWFRRRACINISVKRDKRKRGNWSAFRRKFRFMFNAGVILFLGLWSVFTLVFRHPEKPCRDSAKYPTNSYVNLCESIPAPRVQAETMNV